MLSDGFAFSEVDFGEEEGEDIYAYWSSSCTLWKATESMSTNFSYCCPSSLDQASSDSNDELPLFVGISQEDFSDIGQCISRSSSR